MSKQTYLSETIYKVLFLAAISISTKPNSKFQKFRDACWRNVSVHNRVVIVFLFVVLVQNGFHSLFGYQSRPNYNCSLTWFDYFWKYLNWRLSLIVFSSIETNCHWNIDSLYWFYGANMETATGTTVDRTSDKWFGVLECLVLLTFETHYN